MPNTPDVSGSPDDRDHNPSNSQLAASITRSTTLKYEEMMGGPLPPPQALLEYETFLPGTADRLLILHEKQVSHQIGSERSEAEHRRGNERLELQASISHNRNGPRYALAAVGMLLALAAYVTFAGYPQTAGAITTALVVGLAIAFLTPRVRSEPPPDEPVLPPAPQPTVVQNPSRQ